MRGERGRGRTGTGERKMENEGKESKIGNNREKKLNDYDSEKTVKEKQVILEGETLVEGKEVKKRGASESKEEKTGKSKVQYSEEEGREKKNGRIKTRWKKRKKTNVNKKNVSGIEEKEKKDEERKEEKGTLERKEKEVDR